jgi:hypothetical protein
MLKSLAFIAMLGFAASVHAEQILETCAIDASFALQGPTQIFCDGDLRVKDGTEIVTNGQGLQIVAMGRVYFGTAEGLGLNIAAQSENAGRVFIYARTASGQLNIDNQAQQFGGDVEIEYGSQFRYTQTVDAGPAAAVRTTVNGQLQL